MAISSSTFRNPASRHPRPRYLTESWRSARRSSITAPMLATSTHWSRRCWSSVRGDRPTTKAWCSMSSSRRRWRCRRAPKGALRFASRKRVKESGAPLRFDRSGKALGGTAGFRAGIPFALDRFIVIQKLSLVGHELLGFFQGVIQVAVQDVIVDALDDRPRARHRGDDVTQQIEVSAVTDLRVRRNIHQLYRQIDQLGRRVGSLRRHDVLLA